MNQRVWHWLLTSSDTDTQPALGLSCTGDITKTLQQTVHHQHWEQLLFSHQHMSWIQRTATYRPAGRTHERCRSACCPCHSETVSRIKHTVNAPLILPQWALWLTQLAIWREDSVYYSSLLKMYVVKDKLLPSWWDAEKTNILLKIYTETHRLFNNKKMCWQRKIYITLLCVSIFKYICINAL